MCENGTETDETVKEQAKVVTEQQSEKGCLQKLLHTFVPHKKLDYSEYESCVRWYNSNYKYILHKSAFSFTLELLTTVLCTLHNTLIH
jgi:PHP family Zn ribbon phosphoesterase